MSPSQLIAFGIAMACGTILVLTEHYGWAWVPFVIAAITSE